MKNINESYLKSIVFGFQDALVSTTGAIAGISVGTSNKQFIILAGLVVIVVESLSMAIGEYTSLKAVHQKREKKEENIYTSTFLMGISYFLGGLVPLFPIVFFTLPLAAFLSVGFALMGLFTLGYVKAKVVNVNPLSSAVEILVLGGGATAIGVLVGRVFRI